MRDGTGGKNGHDLSLISVMTRFSAEEAARVYFEEIRWPDGPRCPHCGNANQQRIYKVTANPAKKIRVGLYKCGECNAQFTVTVGTVCEGSHIKLNKWVIAFYMMCSSKTQVSALQLQRQLELGSYRTARFICQRIRYALKDAAPSDKSQTPSVGSTAPTTTRAETTCPCSSQNSSISTTRGTRARELELLSVSRRSQARA
jgi:transposase-like protein